MRLDQDVHFELAGLSVLARLDTTAPENLWELTPGDPEHRAAFRQAIEQQIGTRGTMLGVMTSIYVAKVAEDHALLVYEDDYDEGATMAANIMASLPDWDGESLEGLTGAEDFVGFFLLLEECGAKNFHRSDGRPIEFPGLNRR